MATITIELRTPSVVSERGKELRQRARTFFTRALDVLSLSHMDNKCEAIARGEKERYEAGYVAKEDPFLWTEVGPNY